MNIIFGIWRPQGPRVTTEELEVMGLHTRRYASDEEQFRTCSEIGFGVQSQFTHARSMLDTQPTSDTAGNILIFDGRLDNYRDLLRDLDRPGEELSDSEIILCAYRKWGSDCFVRLIGDWALALWNSRSRDLYLARDHAGTRLLHYTHDAAGKICWATYLEAYVGTDLLDELDPIYIASYLAMLPCYGRSPYQKIQAVLPGHFVKVTTRGTRTVQFWAPSLSGRRSQGSKSNLKAEFLYLFEQSVARRTGPGAPVLAQLSGGMDSTSIVCVADAIRRHSGSQTETLDTLSFYNDSEPSWDERPYFTLVEAKRGRRGFHLDTSSYRMSFERPSGNGAHYLYPGIEQSHIRRDLDVYSLTSEGGYRSILSGIGGDEFTGGVPNAAEEVADLLVTGRFLTGARRAVGWCLASRLSIVDLFVQSVSFLRCHLDSSHLDTVTASIPWLTTKTRRHSATVIRELPIAYFRPCLVSPRIADQSETWWFTLRNQPHLKPSEIYRHEYRYPFLDRDLLEFLLQLPAQQLARPDRRRYLMRAALQGVVPEEILERRRKAYLHAGPLKHVRQLAPSLIEEIKTSLLVEYGYVDKTAMERSIAELATGDTTRWWGFIVRFASLESWLRYRVNNAHSSAIYAQNSAEAKVSADNFS